MTVETIGLDQLLRLGIGRMVLRSSLPHLADEVGARENTLVVFPSDSVRWSVVRMDS